MDPKFRLTRMLVYEGSVPWLRKQLEGSIKGTKIIFSPSNGENNFIHASTLNVPRLISPPDREDPNWNYLGDGVYVCPDDYGICLHANSHAHPTDRIYIEWGVAVNLINLLERILNHDAPKSETSGSS